MWKKKRQQKQEFKENLDVYILVNSVCIDVACALNVSANHLMHSVSVRYT